MDTEDGHLFIKKLAYFVRTHEKALANSIQLQRQNTKSTSSSHGTSSRKPPPASSASSTGSSALSSTGALATAALSLSNFNLTSQNTKAAKLYLTPNQLYYLLCRFEELGVSVGPMNVRLEDIHAGTAPSNYVSFITQTKRPKGRSADQESITSVSSVRSVVSSMSSMFSSFSLSSNSAAKVEKRKAAELDDLKYLYSAFTKIPCLKLALDHRISRIVGFEEFPFDTAVPIHTFKNVSTLEVVDLDFRAFHGWDRLADQLRSLTLKRACVEDPTDILTNIVLDDMDRRRRRSCKTPTSPVQTQSASTPGGKHSELSRSVSTPDPAMAEAGRGLSGSPVATENSPRRTTNSKGFSRVQSVSPTRPGYSRTGSSQRLNRTHVKNRRSSGSSTSSVGSPNRLRSSSSNLLSYNILPASKWQFLRHLSLADNGLATISSTSLAPVASTLHSLDLSSNLFSQVPDSLATLISLRALNLSNCMIDSLHSLSKNPLPAITVLNVRGNRISSLAGIEKLLSLERLDLRENKLVDPTELARLTGMPEFRDVFVVKNPFTKSHSNHRITIFNLFRRSPGYTEDISIDWAKPGYSEKKQLEERVPEATTVPVVQPPIEEDEVSAQHVEEELTLATEDSVPAPPGEPQTPTSIDRVSKISRRRRGVRKRMVDISSTGSPGSRHSTEDSPDMTFVTAVQTPAPTHRRMKSDYSRSSLDDSPALSAPKPRDHENGKPVVREFNRSFSATTATPLGSHNEHVAQAAESGSLSLSSELYKRKIDALKNDFGSGWLSAMEHDRWDDVQRKTLSERKDGETHPSAAITSHTASSSTTTTVAAVVASARKLG